MKRINGLAMPVVLFQCLHGSSASFYQLWGRLLDLISMPYNLPEP